MRNGTLLSKAEQILQSLDYLAAGQSPDLWRLTPPPHLLPKTLNSTEVGIFYYLSFLSDFVFSPFHSEHLFNCCV
jgi:hypothetical protein